MTRLPDRVSPTLVSESILDSLAAFTASVRELLETARLEAQGGPMDAAQVERLIFRAAAPIVHSVAPLTDAQRGELLPNIVRVMLAAFLEAPAR